MLEAYLTFSGRMRRFKLLVYSVVLIVLLVFIGIVGSLLLESARHPVAAGISLQVLLALSWLWAWSAMGVKRLHDIDKSGWHFLWLILAPQALVLATSTTIVYARGGAAGFSIDAGLFGILGGIWLSLGVLFLLLARGTDGPNRFGYPP
jgi:uncharacterized membrane protein YhaH (DUF805 family)